MKKRLRNILRSTGVIELEINQQELQIDIDEMLEFDKDFNERDVHEKIALLNSLAAKSRYAMRETQSELAVLEAEKEEVLRNHYGSKAREGQIRAGIRSEPEWLDKRRDLNICRQELEQIEGLRDALIARLEAAELTQLKETSAKVGESNLSDKEIVAKLLDRLTKTKKKKLKKKKKPKN